MVNRSAFSMVSALQGLQKLESQISQALLQAGDRRPQPSPTVNIRPEEIRFETDKQLNRASLVLNDIDLRA